MFDALRVTLNHTERLDVCPLDVERVAQSAVLCHSYRVRFALLVSVDERAPFCDSVREWDNKRESMLECVWCHKCVIERQRLAVRRGLGLTELVLIEAPVCECAEERNDERFSSECQRSVKCELPRLFYDDCDGLDLFVADANCARERDGFVIVPSFRLPDRERNDLGIDSSFYQHHTEWIFESLLSWIGECCVIT